MKSLSCADMGMSDCTYVAKGNSEKEVIDKAMMHTRTVHPDLLSKMDPSDVISQMKSKIKDE